MSHNEKSPHQSPVHDTRESQPGLDSLAPSDGSHRPTPEPTPPGAQPTAPGSLKAPETANDKLTALDAFRKGSENYALTTNQGVRIAAPAAVALRCWKILSCAKKLPTLTMSVSRRGSFTPADLQRTAISSHIKT